MDEQLRTEFNEWARAGKGESMEAGHRPVGRQAIALMKVSMDSRVLDVGCGSGWATRLFADYAVNGRVTGIDISDEMVRLAGESSRDYRNVSFEVSRSSVFSSSCRVSNTRAAMYDRNRSDRSITSSSVA